MRYAFKRSLTVSHGSTESEVRFGKSEDMKTEILKAIEDVTTSDSDAFNCPAVSFISEIPEPLKAAMTTFIESHPNWDQYRLIQAALAGFLVQNGIESRAITRLYLDNMFARKQSE